MKFIVCAILLLSVVITGKTQAQTEITYFSLEPDIVTNYLGPNARKLGYVRMSVELMLESTSDLSVAEHHMPLLRSTVIDIVGRQPQDKVKSLTGREDIRRVCLETLRKIMTRETGSPIVKEVIFTKYLYQG